jgi:threonine dehydratase
MIPLDWITEAQERIAPHIKLTPLTHDSENDMYIKWDNHQVTGSFKARGAFNKVLTLQEWERERGLITASAGNHGQGVALAGQKTGAPVIVFASEHAAPNKIESMKKLGADVRLIPGGYGEAEAAGITYARETHGTWISAYNDGQIIAGQATLGAETLLHLPQTPSQTWIVPTGGGGLVSGIGASLKLKTSPHPNIRLIAVQSEASPFMHSIYLRGTQHNVKELPSLADGLSGPVEENSLTSHMVLNLVNDFLLVSEDEIAHAIAYSWRHYGEKIEGSAATALAAVLSNKITGRPAVLFITGGNIEKEVFNRILEENEE